MGLVQWRCGRDGLDGFWDASFGGKSYILTAVHGNSSPTGQPDQNNFLALEDAQQQGWEFLLRFDKWWYVGCQGLRGKGVMSLEKMKTSRLKIL